MQEDPTPPLMTVAQLAEALQVHRQTAYDYVRKGVIPAARLPGSKDWRVRRADVEAFIASMFVVREEPRPEKRTELPSPRDWFSLGASSGFRKNT
ncbi:MAG: hypothetical protein FD119_91 [Stygiobacter sp.]|nr:MAG: hypothetical protein FD119_91 [Stygiobacter sp.]